jgi:ribosome-associated protein
VKAIAEFIETELMKKALKPLSIEGLNYAHWVLMDYGDVIVHVFEDETRAYYELEKLWLDAPRIAMNEYPATHLTKDITTAKGQGPRH